MGARDGATQGVLPHMICDAGSNYCILNLDNSSEDHHLILGTQYKYRYLRSLGRRPKDALNRKNVEVAVVAPSSCITCTESQTK